MRANEKAKYLFWLVTAGIFFTLFLVVFLFWHASSTRMVILEVCMLAATMVSLLTGFWKLAHDCSTNDRFSKIELGKLRDAQFDLNRRVNAIVRLNREVAHARSEKQLILEALHILRDLTGAPAAAFTPQDEWGLPLSAFVDGEIPGIDLKISAEHLASKRVIQTCKVCQMRKTMPETACPLLEGGAETQVAVFCFPVEADGGTLGLINLYFPRSLKLSEELGDFLGMFLNTIGIAIQAIRIRQREISTFRQVQLSHTVRTNFVESLRQLLSNIQVALQADLVRLQVKNSPDWLNGLVLQQGSLDSKDLQTIERTCDAILSGAVAQPFDDTRGYVVRSLPLFTVERQVLGVLVFLWKQRRTFEPKCEALMQGMADQFALMLQVEGNMLLLEYQAVIDERKRLAREIHDGLAQTIAYLKLQNVQMQQQLEKGELDQLSDALAQSYSALEEAYLETRQAIDNLRLSPVPSLADWLERTIEDFEDLSGLIVERQLQHVNWQPALEVQMQLMRIVQEALSNVHKHAMASKVKLIVRDTTDELLIEIQDNGRGFSPEEIPGFYQYGLRGMRERAELIGAKLEIDSNHDCGTLVRVRLPRDKEVVA